MAQENIISRCGEDGIFRKACQECKLLLTIARIQILFMQAIFITGPGRSFWNSACGIQIVVSRHNYFAALTDELQAGRSVSSKPVAVECFAEAGDIPQAYAKITALLVDFFQNPLQASQVLMNI
jgi:hypothetical protein